MLTYLVYTLSIAYTGFVIRQQVAVLERLLAEHSLGLMGRVER